MFPGHTDDSEGGGAVFDVRLRGRLINITSDYCFHCSDDGDSCKALRECIVVVVNPQMDKLLFVTYRSSPSSGIAAAEKIYIYIFFSLKYWPTLCFSPLTGSFFVCFLPQKLLSNHKDDYPI